MKIRLAAISIQTSVVGRFDTKTASFSFWLSVDAVKVGSHKEKWCGLRSMRLLSLAIDSSFIRIIIIREIIIMRRSPSSVVYCPCGGVYAIRFSCWMLGCCRCLTMYFRCVSRVCRDVIHSVWICFFFSSSSSYLFSFVLYRGHRLLNVFWYGNYHRLNIKHDSHAFRFYSFSIHTHIHAVVGCCGFAVWMKTMCDDMHTTAVRRRVTAGIHSVAGHGRRHKSRQQTSISLEYDTRMSWTIFVMCDAARYLILSELSTSLTMTKRYI